MDKIIIKGLAVDTLIGVYAWERQRTTRLFIDATLHTDLTAAMQSDLVQHTIDYAQVAACLQQVGRDSQYELLEALAQAMFTALFAQFKVNHIELTITKPNILPDAQHVMICIERSQP